MLAFVGFYNLELQWETPFSFSVLELFTAMIRTPIGLVFMKFGNLSGYKILNTQVFFCLFISTFEILNNPRILICSCFKILLLEMRILYPLVDASFCLTLLLGFVLSACGKLYIQFVLLFCFKMWICCRFTVRNHKVLLDYMALHDDDSMGIIRW